MPIAKSKSQLKSHHRGKILSVVVECIEKMPQYQRITDPPTPEDTEYVAFVARMVRDVLEEKYQKVGLADFVEPPPMPTIKGWFYKGFPPEVVVAIFG